MEPTLDAKYAKVEKAMEGNNKSNSKELGIFLLRKGALNQKNGAKMKHMCIYFIFYAKCKNVYSKFIP